MTLPKIHIKAYLYTVDHMRSALGSQKNLGIIFMAMKKTKTPFENFVAVIHNVHHVSRF